jgi:hypothetical protein
MAAARYDYIWGQLIHTEIFRICNLTPVGLGFSVLSHTRVKCLASMLLGSLLSSIYTLTLLPQARMLHCNHVTINEGEMKYHEISRVNLYPGTGTVPSFIIIRTSPRPNLMCVCV